MLITALKESQNDTRVALSPTSVKNYLKVGLTPCIENNAGLAAGWSNDVYTQAGATCFDNKEQQLNKTHILISINEPLVTDILQLPQNACVITSLDKDPDNACLKACLEKNISLFSMNLIPRISRAQSMDTLSSQANLAGYRGIIEAVMHYNRVIPMMMTAAGMIQPAKVLVLGAGVAGLQAIATAKRLGAIIYAFDVRRAAKEQTESLGAEFIEVSDEDAQTEGGYANETSDEYKQLQANLIDKYAKMSDIVISTALIPGRKAPVLIYKHTVEAMKPGSIIVDLATSKGGNCELSVFDKTIQHGEITIIGNSNLAGLVPATASELYANNLVHLMQLLAPKPEELTFNSEDDIIAQALLCHQGRYLPFQKEQ